MRLPAGQKVVFQRNQSTGREVNALRAGVQFANASAPNPVVSDPSWGFVYNSLPFGMNFGQMLGFLYDAKIDGFAGNGLELAQSILDSRGGTQIVFPVVGSTMQGSGYFPQPIGKPDCNAGDAECLSQGNGIGLAGPVHVGLEDPLPRAAAGHRRPCLRPAGETGRHPGQDARRSTRRSAASRSCCRCSGGRSRASNTSTRYDDLVDFFPVKEATAARLSATRMPAAWIAVRPCAYPIPPGTTPNCTQNIGQIGARYAHHPSWHQPFLMSWIHIDKTVWNGLNAAQKAAVRERRRTPLIESYNAAESVQCTKLKAMLDINKGVNQRNIDGTLRLVDGKPVSAAMTMAAWPDDALKVLHEATDEYLASLAGPRWSGRRRPTRRRTSRPCMTALTQYAAKVGATNSTRPVSREDGPGRGRGMQPGQGRRGRRLSIGLRKPASGRTPCRPGFRTAVD